MRAADFETVVPSVPPAELPIHILQMSSRIGAIGTLAFVAPAGLALLAPFVMVANSVVANPASRQLAAARPASVALIAVGLFVWCALLAPPLSRALAGLSRSRRVAIADGHVTVEERGMLARSSWSEPLTTYAGVMHVVRTTLSATRHELILLHPDRARSVLIAAADQLSEQDIASIAAALGTRVIPSSARYDRMAPASGRMSDAPHLVARAA